MNQNIEGQGQRLINGGFNRGSLAGIRNSRQILYIKMPRPRHRSQMPQGRIDLCIQQAALQFRAVDFPSRQNMPTTFKGCITCCASWPGIVPVCADNCGRIYYFMETISKSVPIFGPMLEFSLLTIKQPCCLQRFRQILHRAVGHHLQGRTPC